MKFRSFLFYILGLLACFNSNAAFAYDCGGPLFHLGWFTATQGKSQHVDIEGLIGDDFSVQKRSDQNLLVGAGYYFKGLRTARASFLYGIEAFYLAPIKVKGDVIQEDLYTNLSYQYSRTNFPIYFAAKALFDFHANHGLVIDLGLGLNIVRTHDYKERSLDGGITIPDKLFTGKTDVAFSATAGLGWRFKNIFRNVSLEIDYRFFYLGEGKLKRNNTQVINSLRTGNCYGNALFFTISI